MAGSLIRAMDGWQEGSLAQSQGGRPQGGRPPTIIVWWLRDYFFLRKPSRVASFSATWGGLS